MRVVMESAEEPQHRFIHHRMPADAVGKTVELRFRRQFAVQQKTGDLKKAAFFGELFDGVAAVQEHSVLAVDVGDLAFAAGRGYETRVKGEDAMIFVQGGDVEGGGAEGAFAQGQFTDCAVGAAELAGLVLHAGSPEIRRLGVTEST